MKTTPLEEFCVEEFCDILKYQQNIFKLKLYYIKRELIFLHFLEKLNKS